MSTTNIIGRKYRSYKYRLYPSPQQETLLMKHFAAVRLVFNLALETKIVAYKSAGINLSGYDLKKQLVGLKQDCAWLNEVNAAAMQNSVMNVEKAYQQFFRGQGYPNFKKKTSKQSYTVSNFVRISSDKVCFPAFSSGIKAKIHRQFEGISKSATISKTPTGKYYISILSLSHDVPKVKAPVYESSTVGIDLGLKTFITSSNGESIEKPRHLRRLEHRIKYVSRMVSKYGGKKNRHKYARLHEKIKNQRHDFLHKTSSRLINSHDTVCMEDLNVSGMMKNHKLAKSVADASWHEFSRQMWYKAEWNGKNILSINRFDPSSKTCSDCGYKKDDLTLSDRTWTCLGCGVLHDRDMNAARNIKSFALTQLSVGYGLKNHGELSGFSEAMIHEDFEKSSHSNTLSRSRSKSQTKHKS